jgi:excisionase family DNA binding protein
LKHCRTSAIVATIAARRYTVRDELLFVDEVAQELRVTRKTVYEWMREKGLEYEVVGARRRIRRSAMEAFIVSGKSRQEQAEKNTTPGVLYEVATTAPPKIPGVVILEPMTPARVPIGPENATASVDAWCVPPCCSNLNNQEKYSC